MYYPEARGMVLARVYECLTVPPNCAGKLEGRSSFSRMGLSVYCTASFVNPGWRGHLPLVLVNNGPFTLKIPPYISVCQLLLINLGGQPDRIYGEPSLRNKYVDDDGGPSYWWRDRIIASMFVAFGNSDHSQEISRGLLELIGTPSDDILGRLELFVSSRPTGAFGNADELLEGFAIREDRRRMWETLLRGSAKALPAVMLSASAGSLFAGPIGALHYIIWTITFLSFVLAFAAYKSGPVEYLGKRELDLLEKRREAVSAN
jgi:hypothetical protein